MKRICFLFCLFILCNNAEAKCSYGGIWITGNVKTIHTTSVIYLEFYAGSQTIAGSLNNKHSVYLKSGNEKISLIVVETLKGDFDVTQVVLKPSKELVIGNTYEIFIDNIENHIAKPEEYNAQLRKFVPLSLTVTNISDADKFTLLSTPVVSKKTLVYYGCGPAKWVYFTVSENNRSKGFVKAVVKNHLGKTSEYIIHIENGVATIGHGMCSGAFKFLEKKEHSVVFTSIDVSVNYGTKTIAVSFEQPTISTETE